MLFADLVGLPPSPKTRRPERVAESIDAFLDLAVEAIFRAGGTLDKFIGDCVMAFFGAPVAQADHALRAVRAAVEIQERARAWNAGARGRGAPRLQGPRRASTAARWWWGTSAAPGASTTRCSATP